MAVLVAAILILLALGAGIWLPPFHPVQLWTIPWALATFLFALRLLPYRAMTWTTAVVIVGGTLAFAAGSLIGNRAADRRLHRLTSAQQEDPNCVGVAAVLTGSVLGLVLVAFLAQVAHDFGVRDAIVSAPSVRLAIAAGATPVTIKYVYLALAAATLGGIAAARAPRRGLRWRWTAFAAVCGASMYFSTGRANIVLALLVGLLAGALSRQEGLNRRRLLGGMVTVTGISLAVFIGGGAIIGKTFSATDISTIDSVFTRLPALSPLAVPYEYLSAPIAGLQQEIRVSSIVGRGGGCATFAVFCQVFHHVGVNAQAEPVIRAFTKPALPWNTYTSLDFLLIDGGFVFFAPLLVLFGTAVGAMWAFAQNGGSGAIAVYVIFATTVLFSAYQNSFFAPHILGSAIISWSSLRLAGLWLRRRSRRSVEGGHDSIPAS